MRDADTDVDADGEGDCDFVGEPEEVGAENESDDDTASERLTLLLRLGEAELDTSEDRELLGLRV